MQIYNEPEVQTDEVEESPATTILATVSLLVSLAALVLALIAYH
jgi:hypothetical protein